MKNIYIFHSEDTFLLNQKANEVISTEDISGTNVFRFDASSSGIEDILTELLNVSLFAERKAVIITHPVFLSQGYNNEVVKAQLASYFENPQEDVLLIILIAEKLEQTPLIALLKKKYGITALAKIEKSNRQEWITKYLQDEGYQIEYNAMEYIISNVANDSNNIINELNKIMLLTHDTKIITLKDAKSLIIPELEEDRYALLNAFLDRTASRALKVYNDFKMRNIDETLLVSMISRGIQDILYVKALIANRKSKEDIAKIMSISTGKAYYVMKNAARISDNELLSLMRRINILEFNIKSGRIDKKIGFELFLLDA